MNLDIGGVEDGIFHIWLFRDRIERSFENVGFHPVSIALEYRIPPTKRGLQIPPRTARPRNPQDRLDKQSVIATAAPRIPGLAKTVRLYLRPLGVRQNKSVHLQPESENADRGNPESQQALEQSAIRLHRFVCPRVFFIVFPESADDCTCFENARFTARTPHGLLLNMLKRRGESVRLLSQSNCLLVGT